MPASTVEICLEPDTTTTTLTRHLAELNSLFNFPARKGGVPVVRAVARLHLHPSTVPHDFRKTPRTPENTQLGKRRVCLEGEQRGGKERSARCNLLRSPLSSTPRVAFSLAKKQKGFVACVSSAAAKRIARPGIFKATRKTEPSNSSSPENICDWMSSRGGGFERASRSCRSGQG